MDVSLIMDKLNMFGSTMEFEKPATDKEISDFQNTNGIILPPQYVDLIKTFDGGELFVPGTRFFGITKKKDYRTIKEVNGKDNRLNYSIPHSFLIIGKLNYGDLLCIDLNNNHEIIQWNHENDEEFCRWNSLEEWLLETIDDYEKSVGVDPG